MAVNIPPHNDDAEKSVLGAALQSGDALIDVLEVINENDFYRDQHKEIFRAMISLNENDSAVDTITVTEELKKRKSLEAVGGVAYIFELPSFAPTISNAREYSKIVSEKSVLRQLIKSSTEIIDLSYQAEQNTESILDRAEQKIFDIAKNKQDKDYSTMKSVMESTMNRMELLKDNKEEYIGMATGFERLDQITSGLQKSDLIIIAAQPSVGKTAFSLNIALNAATKNKKKILFFSLEMPKEMLGLRLLSLKSRVPLKRIFDSSVYNNQAEVEQVNEALEILSESEIYIDDKAGVSIAEIKNKCRRLKAESGLDLIVIDYLQLMDLSEKTENRATEVSKLTRRIKQLARDIECPVILLSQLNRDVEKRGGSKIPQLSDLKESSSIEQDADLIIFLSRKMVDGEEERGVRVVNIAKHRNGETDLFELSWRGEFTQFGNLDKRTVTPEKESPY